MSIDVVAKLEEWLKWEPHTDRDKEDYQVLQDILKELQESRKKIKYYEDRDNTSKKIVEALENLNQQSKLKQQIIDNFGRTTSGPEGPQGTAQFTSPTPIESVRSAAWEWGRKFLENEGYVHAPNTFCTRRMVRHDNPSTCPQVWIEFHPVMGSLHTIEPQPWKVYCQRTGWNTSRMVGKFRKVEEADIHLRNLDDKA